jgi:hypothetical protein
MLVFLISFLMSFPKNCACTRPPLLLAMELLLAVVMLG